MTLIELFILAIGLSMDAMAVSICKGLSVSKAEKKQMLIVGLYFGGFQALMPLLGYWLVVSAASSLTAVAGMSFATNLNSFSAAHVSA